MEHRNTTIYNDILILHGLYIDFIEMFGGPMDMVKGL